MASADLSGQRLWMMSTVLEKGVRSLTHRSQVSTMSGVSFRWIGSGPGKDSFSDGPAAHQTQ